MHKPICQHCKAICTSSTGKQIYPKRIDLHHKNFWECTECKAYVGCHKNTDKALGTAANKELRAMRSTTHKVFDALWKKSELECSRTNAYKDLAKHLDIPLELTHIALFDKEKCEQTVNYSIDKYVEAEKRYTKCKNCLFLVKKDTGYSNWTLEGTDSHCILNKNPDLPKDSWYDKDKTINTDPRTFGCNQFHHYLREGPKGTVQIHIDVENIKGNIANYTISKLLKAHLNLSGYKLP